MSSDRVVIVGGGIGGLTAAALLAARGVDVRLFESAAAVGGKLREVAAGPAVLDGGPTVFTMKWVFEELFDAAGANFSESVALRPLEVLARHAWGGDERLDLYADIDRSADAIGQFAGAGEARGYRRFCERSRRIYELLEGPFLRQPEPRLDKLMFAIGLRFGGVLDIAPFSTMWNALGEYFRDPRLKQLFGRYATYCGSSPFSAPATLMLVAHVEQRGVWSIEGGMYRLAEAVARLATRHGARIQCATRVAEIEVTDGRATGVRLHTGEHIAATAVICNGDVSAVGDELLGPAAARAVTATARSQRSLSALTWAMHAEVKDFPLSRHNVFFSRDYQREFDDILVRSRLPSDPTVYICAQDRDGDAHPPPHATPGQHDRLLCLVNAPANGDENSFEPEEIELCRQRMVDHLQRCGLRLTPPSSVALTGSPEIFDRLYPGTGGALYGPASQGWTTSFTRAGNRTRIAGLYLAGGSAHPGPGVPMAALSGKMAAEQVISDLASTRPSRRKGTAGGTWTR